MVYGQVKGEGSSNRVIEKEKEDGKVEVETKNEMGRKAYGSQITIIIIFQHKFSNICFFLDMIVCIYYFLDYCFSGIWNEL